MIAFYLFKDAPEDVKKAIKGVSKKEFQWVAVANTIDEWSDFDRDGGDRLRSYFTESTDFNYIFRDAKPVIIFFDSAETQPQLRARI